MKTHSLTVLLVLLTTAATPAMAAGWQVGMSSNVQAVAWGRKKESLPEPLAPEPSPDNLVPPAGEEIYFPVRTDGQPFLLNIDTTINLTNAISGFYYDPKWRGETWAPFDQISLIERSTRLMSTFQEYDQFSEFRVLNGVNRTLERWSGFGP